MSPKVSICIPTYEMHGQGVVMLKTLLDSVVCQKYDNIESIVSDHSVGSEIEDLCKLYSSVIYVKNEINRGSSSANLNNAIKYSSGEYLKPMFQDEAFNDSNNIGLLVAELEEGPEQWVVGSCLCYENSINDLDGHHTSEWPLPESLRYGYNIVGPPSAIMYRKSANISFDENLLYLMDCDFYYRLYKICGIPKCLSTVTTIVRVWDGSVSRTLATPDLVKKEQMYLIEKFKNE